MINSDPLESALVELRVPSHWIKSYLQYRDRLESSGFPCIFELDHLAYHLSFEPSALRVLVHNPQGSYNFIEIPKKRGGIRKISAPLPALLYAQRWIKNNIVDKLNIDESAHAYVRTRSIVTHARLHIEGRVIYRTDIRDFFGSISFDSVVSLIYSLGYSQDVSFDIASICCLHGSLPQGASTSPALSNVIFYKTDRALSTLASSFGLRYSRYADDLCFSGEHIPRKFIDKSTSILNADGYILNSEKTRLETSRSRRVICGLSIGDGRVKPVKSFRRAVRAETNNFLKQTKERSVVYWEVTPFFIDRLLGRLNFWKSVEPDNKWIVEHEQIVRRRIRTILEM